MVMRNPINLGAAQATFGRMPPVALTQMPVERRGMPKPQEREGFFTSPRAYGLAEVLGNPVSVESGTWGEALAEALAGGLRGRAARAERERGMADEAREVKLEDALMEREGRLQEAQIADLLRGDEVERWSDPYNIDGVPTPVQRNESTNQLRSVGPNPSLAMVPQQWGPLSPQTREQYPGLNPEDFQENRVTGELNQVPGASQRARLTERQDRAIRSSISSLEATDRVINAVLEARQRIERDPTFSTGMVGGALRGFPGTSAFGLDRAIDTIKANLGFEALQQMRAESPTGGALGQVAVIELQMLQATIDSLDSAQNHRDLLSALDNVETYLRGRSARLSRFLEAYQADGGGVQTAPQEQAPAQQGGNRRMRWNPQTGRLENAD